MSKFAQKETELQVLACMYFNPEIIPQWIGLLTDDMFYHPKNRTIFNTLKRMNEEGIQIVWATFAARAGESALDFITTLESGIVPYEDAKPFIRDLLECYKARSFYEGIYSAHENEDEAGCFNDDVIRAYEAFQCSPRLEERPDNLAVMKKYYERIEAIYRTKKDVRGISTGINGLDKMTYGLVQDRSYILASRPKVGKTSLAMQIGSAAVQQGKNVYVVSLEMGQDDLLNRIFAQNTEIPAERFQTGQFGMEDWNKLSEVIPAFAKSGWHIDDRAGLTMNQIETNIAQEFRRAKYDLIILDYIQRVVGERNWNRRDTVGDASRKLAAISHMYHVPVLIISQLNRAAKGEEKKPPGMADLKETSDLEQDCNAAIFLHRPGFYDKTINRNETTMIVAGNRDGLTGPIQLRFQPAFTKFVEDKFYSKETDYYDNQSGN